MTHEYFPDDKKLVVTLSGEIDHHRAASVRSELDALVDKYTPTLLVLDMSSIGFCDSSGLGLMMGRFRKMASIGGKLLLRSPTRDVTRILALAGMNKYIGIERGVGNVTAASD